MANNVLLLFIVNSILNYVHVHANTVTKARNTWTFIISDYKIIGLELLLTTIKICRPETGKCISAITSCIIMCLSRKSGIREGNKDGEYWEWSGPATPFDLHLSLHHYLWDWDPSTMEYLTHWPKKELNGVAGLLHSFSPHQTGHNIYEIKKALDQPLLNIGVKRLTMELNTGDITVVYYQWKEDAGGNLDGMWRGSSVEFFPPFHRFFHLY